MTPEQGGPGLAPEDLQTEVPVYLIDPEDAEISAGPEHVAP